MGKYEVPDRKNDMTDSYNYQTYILESMDRVVTENNLSILGNIDDDIQFPIENVFISYIDTFKELIIEYEMSDIEYLRYNMRPDLFSYDMYGTLDYEFVLLALNEAVDHKDFNTKKVKYILPSILPTLIGFIVSAEKSRIDDNRATLDEGIF